MIGEKEREGEMGEGREGEERVRERASERVHRFGMVRL